MSRPRFRTGLCPRAQQSCWTGRLKQGLWVPGTCLELPSLRLSPRQSGVFRALGWLSQGLVQAAWRLSVALCWVLAASAEPPPEDGRHRHLFSLSGCEDHTKETQLGREMPQDKLRSQIISTSFPVSSSSRPDPGLDTDAPPPFSWEGVGGGLCFFLLQPRPPHPCSLKTKRARAFCLVLCVPYPRPSLVCLSFLPSHPTSCRSGLLSLLVSAASILHPTLSTQGCESFWPFSPPSDSELMRCVCFIGLL